MTRELVNGAVLGIDVGFSLRRQTTCLSLMEWNDAEVTFQHCLTGSNGDVRAQAIDNLSEHGPSLESRSTGP
jgi:hypothetical protein